MIDLRKEGRILYVSSVDISLSNGPGVNEREFVFALHKAFGNRAHFLVPDPENEFSEISRDFFSFSHNHRQYYPPAYFVHLLSQFGLANSLLASGRFNFVVFRLSDLPFVESCITKRYRETPYVIKTLGTLDALWQQKGIKGAFGKALTPISLKLFRDTTSRALAIDACTKIFLEYHQARLRLRRSKLRLIENSTNTDRFFPSDTIITRSRLGLGSFNRIVGYAGGRAWDRGGRQLVEITPALLNKYSSLGIVIVGGGKKVGYLERRAKELGVDKHCVFTGLVPYDRLPDFVNSFDVGISLDTPNRLNTYGNSSQKVRQYLACGKPVISGPGGNEFLERENLGSIIDGNDCAQIISAVTFWLSLRSEEKAALRQRARNYAVENLSVGKALDERIDFWNERLVDLEQKSSAYQRTYFEHS